MTFIVHFISTIITSAPPRINGHEIPEAGDPYTQESELQVQTTGGYSLSQQGSLPELHNTENDVSDFLNSPKTSTLAYTVDLQEQGLILSWTPR